MELTDKRMGNINSKWIEGLVLLVLLIAMMVFASYKSTKFTTIVDEQTSTWSGSIDNLK